MAASYRREPHVTPFTHYEYSISIHGKQFKLTKRNRFFGSFGQSELNMPDFDSVYDGITPGLLID